MTDPDSILEPQVKAHLASASREVVLIAPFIKEAVLGRLLDVVPAEVRVAIVTRWRLDEIAAGVSDLGVWPLVQDKGASLTLLDNLHAKVFIADESALVGSANLTGAALAGPDAGNLEVLVKVDREDPAVARIEEFVSRMSVPANDELYKAFMAAAAALPSIPERQVIWFPRYRRPRELLSAARGGPAYSSAQTELARAEFAGLGLPADGEGVNAHVISTALSMQPLVRSLLEFTEVQGGRRFGELREWVSQATEVPDADPQTLLRWVLEFLSDQFEYSRPKHSEILRARGQSTDPGYGRTS